MKDGKLYDWERRRVLFLMRVNPDWEGLGERTPEQYAEEVLDAYAAAIRAEQPEPPLDVGRVYAAIDNHARYHRRTNPAHHNRECDGWIASEYARLGSAPSTEEAHRGD